MGKSDKAHLSQHHAHNPVPNLYCRPVDWGPSETFLLLPESREKIEKGWGVIGKGNEDQVPEGVIPIACIAILEEHHELYVGA